MDGALPLGQQMTLLVMLIPLQEQSQMDDYTAARAAGAPRPDTPTTIPLERRDIPPQLSATLEHIVGQLDILTQVLYADCGIS